MRGSVMKILLGTVMYRFGSGRNLCRFCGRRMFWYRRNGYAVNMKDGLVKLIKRGLSSLMVVSRKNRMRITGSHSRFPCDRIIRCKYFQPYQII